MLILFELSGEHPTLPRAELACIGRVIDHRNQVAVAEVEVPETIARLALTHRASRYLGECNADVQSLIDLIRDLGIAPSGTFAVRVKLVHGPSTDLPPRQELERMIGDRITGIVNLQAPDCEIRVVISEDRCYIGKLLVTLDRGAFNYRTPLRRAFFHPGVMLPRTARALVNLSRVRPGQLLLDPFSGTGGILIEADLIGAQVVGGDADPYMVAGSRANVPAGEFFLANATMLPVQDCCMDAVVTDLPYGQSSSITARSMESLYTESLAEIRRVLAPDRFAVVVTHQDIRPIVEQVLSIAQFHPQRVHKSLTRHILLLRR
ncbi:MAG: THUMP domain-containing protein [Methanomicrobiales archaeon]|nr:THUMP domain-containing protein [Methanomicrobiales archaeon]